MNLYRYELIDQHITITSVLEVKQNKSNYSLVTSPSKRIPFSKVGKVLPDEDMILYLTEENIQEATDIFVNTLLNQTEVYLHTADSLMKTIRNLERYIGNAEYFKDNSKENS